MMHRDHVLPSRIGFTLLEVMLTLAMSVVLIILVGGAIQFYARDMNVRDMDIRQTQLAAAVMQMIEDDLRATLHTQPVDTQPLADLLSATASSGGGVPSGDQEDLSAAGMDEMGTALDDMSDLMLETSTLDLQTGAAVLETPGLIGNQSQIQLDLSRLPRLEEYVAMLDETTSDIDDVPSDLKTVAYYVQQAGIIGGVQDPLSTLDSGDVEMGGSGGLVRRSLDRAASVYAASTGSVTLLNQTGELLAPEVTAIEFEYWDGLLWQMEWSSDEYGELPLAVKIRLYMLDPVLAAGQAPQDLASQGAASEAMRVFSHIVRLPMARPIEEDSQSDDQLLEAGI